jgi:hypothetical protein
VSKEIYRILFCSRNCIVGTEAEVVAAIKSASRSCASISAAAGVTGAMIFNRTFFATALEGPLEAVERRFEYIQQNPLNSDLTVLQSGMFESRAFSSWFMALASEDAEQSDLLDLDRNAALSSISAAGQEIVSMLGNLVINKEDWALPDRKQYTAIAAADPIRLQTWRL